MKADRQPSAPAKRLGQPLVFEGDDLSHTDVAVP
jgi:uncharacterized protein with PIN domain